MSDTEPTGIVAPKRIQMSRQKPWRADNPDAVIVDRRTRYGNPFKVGVETMLDTMSGNLINETLRFDTCNPSSTADAVELYRQFVAGELLPIEIDGSTMWAWRPPTVLALELVGKDLACWCPLDQPCHADVLLELANSPSAPPG